ncbi:hypothetical protein CDAR_420711 [Caerostris darwini]|uniref:C2H2-type domain-containing protein n=1 Tax=Caerostris darwini TaxID=1538125 RepID=A0AAV4QWB5_9ARAC|nr:hypothetical protein CDAR_420711 [Caerostris darwini]
MENKELTNISENKTGDIKNWDRPTFYECSDPGCTKKFTAKALVVHLRSCTHKHDCMCDACTLTRKRKAEEEEELAVYIKQPKKFKYSTSENIVRNFSDKNIASQPPRKLASTGKENVPPQRKKPKRKTCKKMDTLDSSSKIHHNRETCFRTIFCELCKSHISAALFGVHALQHGRELDEKLFCCLCSAPGYRLAEAFLIHFFTHCHHKSCNQCCNCKNCSQPRRFERFFFLTPDD